MIKNILFQEGEKEKEYALCMCVLCIYDKHKIF